jgi:phosphohistidine phosphatase
MTLYLLRHAIAEDGAPGKPDAARALTLDGIVTFRLQVQALHHMGLTPGMILTSPHVRTRQTADLLAEPFGLDVVEERALRPGCRLTDVIDLHVGHGQPEHLMIVGHQPDLGEIVHQLTGARVRMRKGTLAVVRAQRLRPASGVLDGLYDPDCLAALGRAVTGG